MASGPVEVIHLKVNLMLVKGSSGYVMQIVKF